MKQLATEQLYIKELVSDCKTLTKREAEVAEMLCRQLTIAEIASKLFISPRTVGTHIENIKNKLNVGSKNELIMKLIRHDVPDKEV